MSDKKNIDITSRLIKIELISFSIEPQQKDVSVNPLEFAFRYEVNVKPDQSLNGFQIKCKTLIFSNPDENFHLGTIETYGEFVVSNLKQVLEHFNGNTPTDLLALFTGVVISSTRGMLIIKSQNTILEGVIIPMMDPKVFFTPESIKSATSSPKKS